MGITSTDIPLIEAAFKLKPDIRSVCELGSQNLYLETMDKPPFADTLYKQRFGITDYTCIDLAGDNNAQKFDMSIPFSNWFTKKFDLVTDFGTSEHVVQMEDYQTVTFHEGHINSIYPKSKESILSIESGYYHCWRNKHNILRIGGIMINVNPKTGYWPEHGYTYLDEAFYHELAALCGYKIVSLESIAAMGNHITGINVCCVLQKIMDMPFVSFEYFNKIPVFRS